MQERSGAPLGSVTCSAGVNVWLPFSAEREEAQRDRTVSSKSPSRLLLSRTAQPWQCCRIPPHGTSRPRTSAAAERRVGTRLATHPCPGVTELEFWNSAPTRSPSSSAGGALQHGAGGLSSPVPAASCSRRGRPPRCRQRQDCPVSPARRGRVPRCCQLPTRPPGSSCPCTPRWKNHSERGLGCLHKNQRHRPSRLNRQTEN